MLRAAAPIAPNFGVAEGVNRLRREPNEYVRSRTLPAGGVCAVAPKTVVAAVLLLLEAGGVRTGRAIADGREPVPSPALLVWSVGEGWRKVNRV